MPLSCVTKETKAAHQSTCHRALPNETTILSPVGSSSTFLHALQVTLSTKAGLTALAGSVTEPLVLDREAGPLLSICGSDDMRLFGAGADPLGVRPG